MDLKSGILVGRFTAKRLSAATALLGIASLVSAAPIDVLERDSTQQVSFIDSSAFSDASFFSSSDFSISGNAGDTLGQNFVVPHGFTGFGVSASSGFAVSNPVLTPGTPNDVETFAVSATTGGAGQFNVMGSLGVNVAPSGAVESLSSGVSSSGYHYLNETYDPTAAQTNGAVYFYQVVLPGNYSAVGTATNQHELLNLNPNWIITKNFVFDGTNTTFAAQIGNYNSQIDQIDLQYQIYGAPVPLPPSVLLLLSGILGLGAIAKARSFSSSSL